MLVPSTQNVQRLGHQHSAGNRCCAFVGVAYVDYEFTADRRCTVLDKRCLTSICPTCLLFLSVTQMRFG